MKIGSQVTQEQSDKAKELGLKLISLADLEVSYSLNIPRHRNLDLFYVIIERMVSRQIFLEISKHSVAVGDENRESGFIVLVYCLKTHPKVEEIFVIFFGSSQLHCPESMKKKM